MITQYPKRVGSLIAVVALLIHCTCSVSAFTQPNRNVQRKSFFPLHMSIYNSRVGSNKNNYKQDRSKRQERVGNLIRNEIATVIQLGFVKNTSPIKADLLKNINVVNADVSPDLKQARVTVSIMNAHYATKTSEDDNEEEDGEEEEYALQNNHDPIVDKRKAFSWLVKNSKQIRHSICQRLSYMKSVPTLHFVQVDVGAAVDVMYLIDQVAKGYKREDLGLYNSDKMEIGMNTDEYEQEDESEEWIDENDFEWNDDDDDENLQP